VAVVGLLPAAVAVVPPVEGSARAAREDEGKSRPDDAETAAVCRAHSQTLSSPEPTALSSVSSATGPARGTPTLRPGSARRHGATEFDRCPSTAGTGAAPAGAGAASRPVRAPGLPMSPLCRRRRRCSNEGLRRGGMGVLVSSHAHAPPEPESSPERARRAVTDTATAGVAAVDAVTSGPPAREAGRAGVAGAHGAAPAATTTARPAAPAGVLLLQRLAGNRATAALLHARVGPASHGPAASRVPVVQRS